MPTEFLAVGRVARPHGVRGELLLESLADFPQRLDQLDTVYLGPEGEPPQAHPLAGARLHRGRLLIRLGDCPNRDAAEAFRGQIVQVPVEAAAAPPPGYYYHHQVIGLEAVSDTGEVLGRVTEILDTGANDVYVISGPRGELLLPAIRSVVLEVDLAASRMTVHLLEGLGWTPP